MAYLYDLTDTWNAAGTVFNAIKMNVTNSASAAGSKLVTLQVGATERFSVDKDGNGYFLGTVDSIGALNSANIYLRGNSGTIGMVDNSASILAYNGTGSGGITNALRFITGAAERVRIDASGNVGIGTPSPTGGGGGTTLNVFGGSAASFRLSSSTDAFDLFLAGGSGFVQTATAIPMVFRTNATERMRIDSSGNLLVGTTAEDANIGGASGTGMQFSARVGFGLRSSINTDVHYWNKYPTGDLHQFRCAGVAVGTISVTGSATAYNTSSDARLKHDIVDAPEASNLLDAIKVRSFKWNVDGSEQRYGMIAQELLEVAPEAVTTPADPDAMMGVDYSKLVPMLIKELQSLRARVAQLEGN
jgi:hypothetical protein